MRLLIVGAALAWIGLAVSPATAQDDRRDPFTRYRFAACICYFAPHDTDASCRPRVSCYTQGGRCAQRCPAQSGYQDSN
jgi:hypothetical protein